MSDEIFRGKIAKPNGRNSQGVTKNDGLDLVEVSASSETEKETADTTGVGNLEAPAPTAKERSTEENFG
jgi:hypothetical protein